MKKKKRSPKKLSKTKPIKIDRQPSRSWGLATRLEHRRVKGKNRKRPGKEK